MNQGKGVNPIDPSTLFPNDLNGLNGLNDLSRKETPRT